MVEVECLVACKLWDSVRGKHRVKMAVVRVDASGW
jgi:hypothetical protein